MRVKLQRDITAAMLAMDAVPGEEGYPSEYVIAHAGTWVRVVEDMEDGALEVTDFENDPYAVGYIPVEAVERTECPECGTLAVLHRPGMFPVCQACEWTAWHRDPPATQLIVEP